MNEHSKKLLKKDSFKRCNKILMNKNDFILSEI